MRWESEVETISYQINWDNIKTSPSFGRNARLAIRYSLKKSLSQVVRWPPTVSNGLVAVKGHGSVVFIMAPLVG